MRILIVEDSETDARLLQRELDRGLGKSEYRRVEEAADFEAALAEEWDVIICDWSLPRFGALAALDVLRRSGRDVPLIIVSGTVEEDQAVAAMRAGARDYLSKDRLFRLVPAVEREARERQERASRLRNEEALRERARVQEARFRALVEKSQDVIFLSDAEGKVLYVSPSAARVFGYTPEQLVGRAATTVLHPDELELAARARVRILSEPRATIVSERRIVRSDGSVGWIETISTNLLADPAVRGVVGNVRDVTERHRSEAELRESVERYRLLFESSPLPKWLYDVETRRFLEVNAAAVRLYGYSREELLSMTADVLEPPQDRAEAQAAFRPGATGTSELGVWRHLKKGGSSVEVAMTAHTFMIGGRLCRLVVARDVTDTQRLEEQLRQAIKMEAIGRLAGAVAHDFNNMMSVVLSYADLIRDDMAPEDPLRADVEEIKRAGERAAALTQQLLAFSRQQVVVRKVVDLNQILRDLSNLVMRLLGEDVEVETALAPALGKCRADAGQIEQVIMNLVVNARDAMPSGGRLELRTANVDLDEEYCRTHLGVTTGRYVMLAVADSGVGMDRATQARIFEPFFTTKAKGKGTGLGLSTVFGIVEQSGGNIWVYSEPGRGAVFKIFLPRVDDEPVVVQAPVDPALDLGGHETVLLVEDEAQIRKVTRHILERKGYRVFDAPDGAEALALYERLAEPIHLLLTDVVMPKLNGPQLAQRLLASRPELHVLFMSGYTDGSLADELAVGAAFLQKPFTPEVLARKVREVLKGGR